MHVCGKGASQAKTGPAKTGPVKTGPAKTGPAKTGPAKTGPVKTGPAKTLQGQAAETQQSWGKLVTEELVLTLVIRDVLLQSPGLDRVRILL